ncbi:hypothetical protein TSOC_012212 [Tetrabaena socialis]|uniref:Uncharacterized protein n=1 Tax=Tetrabaena socialis TaxID=47790 RepID=A0A2J7ZNM0_9CHLO|nr:hypothetical protein TSOC_012212 [Tetrabaena socialis]|eukprot:PNH01866.1 hypothetical protein TSOC_012212 [Tetrabaena socialis]
MPSERWQLATRPHRSNASPQDASQGHRDSPASLSPAKLSQPGLAQHYSWCGSFVTSTCSRLASPRAQRLRSTQLLVSPM